MILIRNKIICILAVIMCFALVGCNSGNNSKDIKDTQNTTNPKSYRCKKKYSDGSWTEYPCDEFGNELDGPGLIRRHREYSNYSN